jgi:transposase InsO family protein
MFFLFALLVSWNFLRCWIKSLRFRKPPRFRYFRRRRLAIPALSQRRTPLWVIEAVLRRARCPQYGFGRVAATFNRCHVTQGMSVSRSFVAYTIRRHQYQIACLRQNFRKQMPLETVKNETWALDLTGRADETGRVCTLLGLLGHGSRKLLRLKPLARQCAWTLLGHLCLAIAAHGKPCALRTDNALVFHSEVFCRVLRWMGIRQQFTKPGCPWMNGRIERLFGTLKKMLKSLTFRDEQALDTLLARFCFAYNTLRPHSALNGATPDEA